MNHLCLLSYIYFKAGNQLGSSWVNNTAIHIEQNQHGLHDSVISINMIISILTYYIHTAKRSTNRENSEFDAHGEDHSTGNAIYRNQNTELKRRKPEITCPYRTAHEICCYLHCAVGPEYFQIPYGDWTLCMWSVYEVHAQQTCHPHT